MAEFEDMQAAMGGLDPLSAPVPGESLTADPEARLPFEQPPINTDRDAAVEDLFFRMTADEAMDDLINLMRAEVSLEDIAQVVLFGGFREGAFTPDLMLNMIEPTIYILIWMADYAGIEPVLDPESEFDIGIEEDNLLVPEDIPVPSSVPDTLLQTIRGRLDTEESTVTPEEAQ